MWLNQQIFIKKETFLHRLDVRIKILVLFVFVLEIVVSNLPHEWMMYMAFALVLMFLGNQSKIPIRWLLTRYGMILPFLLALTMFYALTPPGEPIWSVPYLGILVYDDGLINGSSILIKSSFSFFCLMILLATSSFSSVLKGFSDLRVPKLFILLISFFYRYIFIFLDESKRMVQAFRSRSLRYSTRITIRTLSQMIGLLFIRSYERGERIYQSMISRGFNGEIKVIQPLNITKLDIQLGGLLCLLGLLCKGLGWFQPDLITILSIPIE